MNEKTPDALSRLLRNWKPVPEGSTEQFVDETMRQLRRARATPVRSWLRYRLEGLLEEWLPSPSLLLPVTAALILIMGFQYWTEAIRMARTGAALTWHDDLSQPLAKNSLAGVYTHLAREPSKERL